MKPLFLRFVIGAGIVIGAIAGGLGIYKSQTSPPPPPPPGSAHVWASPSGTLTSGTQNCVRFSTPVTKPGADSTLCGDPDIAYKLAQPGDTIRLACNAGEQYGPNIAAAGQAATSTTDWLVRYDSTKAAGSSAVTFTGDGSGCKPKLGVQTTLNYGGNDLPDPGWAKCQAGQLSGGHCQSFIPAAPAPTTVAASGGTLAAGTYYYSIGYTVATTGGNVPEAPVSTSTSVVVGASGKVTVSWPAPQVTPANVTYYIYRTQTVGGPGSRLTSQIGTVSSTVSVTNFESFVDTGALTPAPPLAKTGYDIQVASTAGFYLGSSYSIYLGGSPYWGLTCTGGADATHFFGCRLSNNGQQYAGAKGNALSVADSPPGSAWGNGSVIRQGFARIWGVNDATFDGFQWLGENDWTSSGGCGGCGTASRNFVVSNSLISGKTGISGDGNAINNNVFVANEDSMTPLNVSSCGPQANGGCTIKGNDFQRVATALCIGNDNCHFETSWWGLNQYVDYENNRCWDQGLYCIFLSYGSTSNAGPLRICNNYFGATNGPSSTNIQFNGNIANGATICNNSFGSGMSWDSNSGRTVLSGIRVYNNLGINIPCTAAAFGSPATLDVIVDHNATFGTGVPCGGPVNSGGLVVDGTNFTISSSALVWSNVIGPALDLISAATPAEAAGDNTKCPLTDLYGTVRANKTPCDLGAQERSPSVGGGFGGSLAVCNPNPCTRDLGFPNLHKFISLDDAVSPSVPIERSYVLYRPNGLTNSPTNKVPLVIAFAGAGQNCSLISSCEIYDGVPPPSGPNGLAANSGLGSTPFTTGIADANKFIVAFAIKRCMDSTPGVIDGNNGTVACDGGWFTTDTLRSPPMTSSQCQTYPSGPCLGLTDSDEPYIRDMIAKITAEENIDTSKIYAIGQSAGSAVVTDIGCDSRFGNAYRFAGLAAERSTWVINPGEPHSPQHCAATGAKFSFTQQCGGVDPNVPCAGKFSGGSAPCPCWNLSQQEDMEFYLTRMGCTGTFNVPLLDVFYGAPSASNENKTWGPCAFPGQALRYSYVPTGAHTWYKGESSFNGAHSAQEAWDFWSAYWPG